MKIKNLLIVPILLLASGCSSSDRLVERVEVIEYWMIQQTESSPQSRQEAMMMEKATGQKLPVYYK